MSISSVSTGLLNHHHLLRWWFKHRAWQHSSYAWIQELINRKEKFALAWHNKSGMLSYIVCYSNYMSQRHSPLWEDVNKLTLFKTKILLIYLLRWKDLKVSQLENANLTRWKYYLKRTGPRKTAFQKLSFHFVGQVLLINQSILVKCYGRFL